MSSLFARRAGRCAVLLGSFTATSSTRADPASFVDASLRPILASPIGAPIAVGGHGGGPARSGPFIGVDSGWSVALANHSEPASGAWSFGARVGFQASSGLAAQLRYDDLGVRDRASDGTWQSPTRVGSAGLRYSLPFIVPLPFVEALGGVASNGGGSSFAVALGGGLSIPLGRHVAVDASLRDFVTRLDGLLRHTITLQFGIVLAFGGPGR